MSLWIGLPGACRCVRSRPLGGAAGFTLLEVIVAVAILALSLGARLQIFSSGLKGARVAGHHTVATLQAESRLAATGIETALREGEFAGEFDNGHRWLVTVRPHQGADAVAAVTAYEVVVTVSWDGGGAGKSVSLSTLRLASREVP